MKKHLLIFAMLAVAVFAFAYSSRSVYTEIELATMDILNYITNDPWPNLGEATHDPNWLFEVTDVENNETWSTTTYPHPRQIMVGKYSIGPVPLSGFAYFNPQIFSTAGPSAGKLFRMKLTYLPNTDSETNFATRDYIMGTGTGPIFLYDDNAWILPDTIVGAPQPPEQFSLQVNSTNYPGAAIWKDGADTGQVTPWTFTGATADVAGTYSVVMDNVTWLPADYIYDGLTDQTVNFVGVYTPGFAANPYPANGADIEIAHDAVATTYDLTWEAPAGLVTGYKIIWDNNPVVDLGDVLTWTTPAIAEGNYTWSVIPYVTDPLPAPRGRSTGGLQVELAPIKAKIVAPQPRRRC